MKKILSILIIIVISFITLTNFVLAGDSTEDGYLYTDSPPAGSGSASDPVQLTNPLTGKNTFDEKTEGVPILLGKIINYAMGLIGSLALVMFIYGGAVWMLSAGNQEQVTKGKNIVIWAALGIAIIFVSYALVRFVITAIGGAT